MWLAGLTNYIAGIFSPFRAARARSHRGCLRRFQPAAIEPSEGDELITFGLAALPKDSNCFVLQDRQVRIRRRAGVDRAFERKRPAFVVADPHHKIRTF